MFESTKEAESGTCAADDGEDEGYPSDIDAFEDAPELDNQAVLLPVNSFSNVAFELKFLSRPPMNKNNLFNEHSMIKPDRKTNSNIHLQKLYYCVYI